MVKATLDAQNEVAKVRPGPIIRRSATCSRKQNIPITPIMEKF